MRLESVLIRKWKVLVTAPSNVAVDNILERLVCPTEKKTMKELKKEKRRSLVNYTTSSISAVRLGHPARMKESILPCSLEYLIQKHEGKEIINDVRNEIESHLKKLSRTNMKGKDNNIDRRMIYHEIKNLKAEIKSREEKVIRDILNSQAQVVLATNVGAASYLLEKYAGPFDLVIIDEAAQALEAACWIPILKGRRLVLAGDHRQLPPTIKSSSREVQLGLGITLFERLMEKYSNQLDQISRMLQIQYRMNEMISNWASAAMYSGKLLSHESVKFRRLEDLPNICKQDQSYGNLCPRDLSIAHATMVIVDTAGCNMLESVNAGGSRFNEGEANIVAVHVRNLLRIGLAIEDIAIISPYNGQVFLLRNILNSEFPSLEIRSVDGFQGGEKEAVVLSLVRSSGRGGENGVGFLKDDRRLNVAITRARRHCCIICDTETISQHKFLRVLVDWVETHGDVVSAMEFEQRNGLSHIDSHKHVQDAPVRSKSKAVNTPCTDNALYKAISSTSSTNFQRKAPTDNSQQTVPTISNDDDAITQLRRKLHIFSESAQVGEKMSFIVSKFQRRQIHQICEDMGLAHFSEGTEGVDRKVVVSKNIVRNDGDTVTADDSASVEKSNFGASHSAEEKSTVKDMNLRGNIGFSVIDETVKAKVFVEKSRELAMIAEERLIRREGAVQTNPKCQVAVQRSNVDEDMEYLNAEISRLQNSHGRKIEAHGKNYLTIVNGVLTNKPKVEQSASKNSSAKIKLDQKIKDAQQLRKSKTESSRK